MVDVREIFASHFPRAVAVRRPPEDTSDRPRKVVVRYWTRPGHEAAGAVFADVTVAQACAELVRQLGVHASGLVVRTVTCEGPALAVMHCPVGADGRFNPRVGRIVASVLEGLTEQELLVGLAWCAVQSSRRPDPSANDVRA